MKKELKEKRDLRLDIIRIFSLFCVVSVHFFLNSGYYNEIMAGKAMIIMTIVRSFFIVCVPMFIVLTGYLMNKKELSKSYYKGIIRTLSIYFICSIVFHIFIHFYSDTSLTIKSFIKDLLSFDGTSYSWYIEMYIGLFLLIPFFNLIINNFKSQKDFKILLVTLLFLIGIPNVLNIIKFYSPNWIKNPDVKVLKLFPAWWASIYPVFYYFLGAYIYKYKDNISKYKNIILLIIIVFISGLLNYFVSHDKAFIWSTFNQYGSFLVMMKTYLVFSLLLQIKVEYSKGKEKFLKTISNACLGAYLISCIFDKIYYDILCSKIINVKDRFLYAPLMVILVFVSSIILALIIDFIYDRILYVVRMMKGDKNEK